MSSSAQPAKAFILAPSRQEAGRFSAVSLFSAGGIADVGFRQAGFDFRAHVELQPRRAEIGRRNFPDSEWIVGDVGDPNTLETVKQAVGPGSVDLCIATPPCQGLSSSNPARGNRAYGTPEHDALNRLMLQVPAYATTLRPRVIVAENVAAVLTYPVYVETEPSTVLEAFKKGLPDYDVYSRVVNVADFGVPQRRRRAVVIAIRKCEPASEAVRNGSLSPWPNASHAQDGNKLPRHVNISEWLREFDYRPLDPVIGPRTSADPLHRVELMPHARYHLIVSIPPYSGSSAWRNNVCQSCEASSVPRERATCHVCGAVMVNRPVVERDGSYRLIRGFHSSYQRMHPNKPAPPVMTNSNRVGGAYKIHPWEHRTMTPRECADLQTVPRFYDWGDEPSRHQGVVRELVGEALPSYFAFQLGTHIGMLLKAGQIVRGLAQSD